MSETTSVLQALSGRLRTPTPTLLAILGWLLTGIALTLFDPVIAGMTLAVALPIWLADSPVAAIAVTQVGVATAISTHSPLSLVVLEGGPILLAGTLLAAEGVTIRSGAVAVVTASCLGGVTLGAIVIWESVVAGGALLCLSMALLSYLLHRYELVALGLIDNT